MLIIVVIGLLLLVVTVGLGVWSYRLGKRNRSNLVGIVITVAYFVVRAILAMMMQSTTRGLVSSLVGSLLFSLIYYGLFAWGKHRATR
ncbi:hypothetical protein [Lactiplantibacillus plantarum]|uniref:hypothetical protein n=1 Tax=Lactiplantibacillus plantarum TaxID=1590 RepID=UPI0031B69010